MGELYVGMDLHSSNTFTGIMTKEFKRIFGKRLANDLPVILGALEPFRNEIQGIVVESTYNWYWLVDGLMDAGYACVHLANPSAVKQYEGLKHVDDRYDSFWLAHLLSLGILPEGYIYPKEQRHIRDLSRRRLLFVRQRTTQILSFQSMVTRNLGIKMSVNKVKQLTKKDIQKLFDSPHLVLVAKSNINTIDFLNTVIKDIEKEVLSQVKLREEFALLQTIPGIGKILALTIMLEMDTIKRFEKVGNYSSYCRCVNSQRLSNGKKKGENNRKNGNKYLAWAYVEAAHFAVRYNEKAKRFYQRKKSKRNGIVATKALSNKIARASYYMLRDQVPFDEDRLHLKLVS